jgi:hypothetical protein
MFFLFDFKENQIVKNHYWNKKQILRPHIFLFFKKSDRRYDIKQGDLDGRQYQSVFVGPRKSIA